MGRIFVRLLSVKIVMIYYLLRYACSCTVFTTMKTPSLRNDCVMIVFTVRSGIKNNSTKAFKVVNTT